MTKNKTKRKVLSFMLTIAMCITLIPAGAFAKVDSSCYYTYHENGDWTYLVLTDDCDDEDDTTNDKTIALVQYAGEDTQVVVPSSIEHKGEEIPVTQIVSRKGDVFPSTVTKITFQDGIKYIGDNICKGKNNISEVVFADSIEEIGARAFDSCKLTEIVLPASIKKIGSAAFNRQKDNNNTEVLTSVDFSKCVNLESLGSKDNLSVGPFAANPLIEEIDLSNCTNLNWIEYRGFENCFGLKSVKLPTTDKPFSMGTSAFIGCSNLESIDLSGLSGLTQIPDRAFESCNLLTEVKLPESVTSIGSNAFAGTDIEDIDLTHIETIGEKAFSGQTNISEVVFGDCITSIGKEAFDNVLITELNIPAADVTIGDGAFKNNKNLTKVDISRITSDNLANDIFNGCSNLSEVKFNNAVENIGNNAFRGTALSSVTLPANLVTIGKFAFSGTNLTDVSIPDGVTSIGDSAFADCESLENFTWPDNDEFTTVNREIFSGCDKLSYSVVESIPTSVETIGYKAFWEIRNEDWTCIDLTGLTNLTTIYDGAFGRAQYATSLKLPDTALTIESGAFKENPLLASVKWPRNDGFVKADGFNDCKSISDDVINSLPDSVTTIADYAFKNCGMVNLTVPSSIEKIGKHAFENNVKLKELNIGDNVDSIGEYVFASAFKLEKACIGACREIGEHAFYGDLLLADLTLSEGIKYIGNNAFYNCTGLAGKTVVIPKSLKKLSSEIFGAYYGLGDEENYLTLIIANQNIKVDETNRKDLIKIGDKDYANAFANAYVNINGYEQDDNGDDTFLKTYVDAANEYYINNNKKGHINITPMDKVYSHKVSGDVPKDAKVYVRFDGDEYKEVAVNDGKFETEINEGRNIFVKVSLKGYYDKIFHMLDTNYTADWKVCTLKEDDFEELPVSNTMQLEFVNNEGESVAINYANATYKLYAKGNELAAGTDYRVQLPYVYILNDNIGANDELRLEVTLDSSDSYTVTPTVTTKKAGVFKVVLIPWGSLELNTSGEFAGNNNLIVFDSDSNVVYSDKIINGTFTLTDMKAGTYKVLVYNTNSYFQEVNSTDSLEKMGLGKGSSYSLEEVVIEDNAKTTLDMVIPLLDTVSLSKVVDSDACSVSVRSNEVIAGQDFDVQVYYSLINKDSGNIVITLPQNTTVNYVYNGSTVADFTPNAGKCTIPVTKSKGTIYIGMKVNASGKQMISATYTDGTITVPVGNEVFDVSALRIKTVSDKIDKNGSYVNVYTTPLTTVEFYAGDSDIPQRKTTNAVGRVRFDFEGPKKALIGDEYTVTAKTELGQAKYSYSYYPEEIYINKFGFLYRGGKYDVIENNRDKEINYVYYGHIWDIEPSTGDYWTFYATLTSEYKITDAVVEIIMMDSTTQTAFMTMTDESVDDDGNYVYQFSGTKYLPKAGFEHFDKSLVPEKFNVLYAYDVIENSNKGVNYEDVQVRVETQINNLNEAYNQMKEQLSVEDYLEETNSDFEELYNVYANNVENPTLTKDDFLVSKEELDIGKIFFGNQTSMLEEEWFEDLPQEAQVAFAELEDKTNMMAEIYTELYGLPKSITEYSSWDEVYEACGYEIDKTKTLKDYSTKELKEAGYTISSDGTYAYKIEEVTTGSGNSSTTDSVGNVIETKLSKEGNSSGTKVSVVTDEGSGTYLKDKDTDMLGYLSDPIKEGSISKFLEFNEGNIVKVLESYPKILGTVQKYIPAITSNMAMLKWFKNAFGTSTAIQSLIKNMLELNQIDGEIKELEGILANLRKLREYYGKDSDATCFGGNGKYRATCLDWNDNEIMYITNMIGALNDRKYHLTKEMYITLITAIGNYIKYNPVGTGIELGGFLDSVMLSHLKSTNAMDYNSAKDGYLRNKDLRSTLCPAPKKLGSLKGVDNKAGTGGCGGGNGSGSGKGTGNGKGSGRSARGTTKPAIDPNGTVYEAFESNTLEGVTATIWYSAKADGSGAKVWDATEYDQINPQVTGKDGYYNWDVPTGYWQVVFEKEGYKTARTDWLPVPPPQLGLKTAMVADSAPEVTGINAYGDYVEITFDQYMDTSVTPKATGYTVEWGESTQGYAKSLKLKYSDGDKKTGSKVTVNLTGAKNYAGVAIATYEAKDVVVKVRPAVIETNYDETITFPLVDKHTPLIVAVKDVKGNYMENVSVKAAIGNELIATVGEAEVKEMNGIKFIKIPVTALMAGMTTITFTVEGTAVSRTYNLYITDSNDVPLRPTATIGETVFDGSSPKENTITVNSGEKLVLECETEGAVIYYTTDNTCPCQDIGSRKLYTGPITLTENTYFRIAAYKDGMEYSDRLNITVTVHKHSYTPKYTWSADGKTCNVTLTCACGKKVTKKATVTSTVKTKATYTAKGITQYTAKLVFEGKTYTSTKNVTNIAKKILGKTTITSIANSANGITIKYKKVTGASGYNIYRKAGSGAWSKIKTTTALSFNDTKATKAKTNYQYRVIAYVKDSKGTALSAASNIISMVRVARPTVKTAENAAKGITVKWNKVSGATGYYLYRSVNNSAFKKYKTIKGESKISYIDTGANINGGKYAYKVVAYRTVSGKTYTSAMSLAKVTYRIKNVIISKAVNVVKNAITVNWSKNVKVTGYVIQYITGKTKKTVKVTKPSIVTKKLTGLKKGATYKVSVRAYKTVGKVNYWSTFSPVKNVKIIK